MAKLLPSTVFKSVCAGLVLALILTVTGAEAAGESQAASKTIDRFHDALITMMKKGPQLGFEGRVRYLSPIADKTFDYEDMSERSVGPKWAEMSAAEHAKIVAAFRKFSIYTYAREFRSFDGERFDHTGEPITGRRGGILVRTRIIPEGGEPVALNYLLHDAGGWKVYDIYLAGTISEVARRREDFSAVLREKGAAGMVAALEEKSARLQAEDTQARVN